MGLKQKVVEMIAGKDFEKRYSRLALTEKEMEEYKGEIKSLREAVARRDEREEALWRPITAVPDRDLRPMTQDRMQRVCFKLYDQNGFAHQISEMNKNFVIGDGLKYKAIDDDVQKVLDDFWNDSTNDMDLKLPNKVLELGLFGEQGYPVFVNEVDGHVKLGYLDPQFIDDIKKNPENAEEDIAVVPKKVEGITKDLYKIIRENPETGYLEGEAFFFAVNKTTTAKRGRSDLLTLADWIDGYERFLFNRLERSHLMNVFLWDIEVEGADKKVLRKLAKETRLPKPGSMRWHNEKQKWNAVVPKLEAGDASQEAKLFRNHTLAQAGYPPHYFGGGEGMTRATALEMGTPVFKRLKARQEYVKYMVSKIFRFVIDQAIIHETLKKDVDKSFSLFFPRLTEKDISAMSTAILQFTSSLTVAVDSEFISQETAKTAYMFLLSQAGIEVPESNSESKKIEEQKYREFYIDYIDKKKERRSNLATDANRKKSDQEES